MPETLPTLYGANWCPDCRNTKTFLGEMDVEYKWVDIDGDTDANEYIASVNNGKRVIPTVVLGSGVVLVNPSNAELAEALGIKREASLSFYDVIVIGAGPAGLTTALYLAREGQRVLVLDKGPIGGQVALTDRLDNFPGFPDGIEGREFSERLGRQAKRFGVEILTATEVIKIESSESQCSVKTATGQHYASSALLIATGSTYRRLNAPGEEQFIGAGVHFCATCDGPFYKGKNVAVIGGGNSAAEESLFLTRFVDHVDVFVRGETFIASKLVSEKVMDHDQIDVHFLSTVKRFEGENSLERIVVNSTDGERSIDVAAVFLFIGLLPNTKWLPDQIDLEQGGFIKTGINLETSIRGFFAAGDVRSGSIKQAASSAGEGAAAALMIRDYLNRR